MSAQPSKGQCAISKILSPLGLSLFIEQKVFFPGTYFAIDIENWFGQGQLVHFG